MAKRENTGGVDIATARSREIERDRVAVVLGLTSERQLGRVVVETDRGNARTRLDFGRRTRPRYLDTYHGLRFETPDVAEACLTLIRNSVARGRTLQDVIDEVGPRGGQGPAIEPMIQEYLSEFERKTELGDRSWNSHRELQRWITPGPCGYLCWWYGSSLYSIDEAAVESWSLWMAEQGIGAKTRRNVMAGLHSFCVWAKKRRRAFELPEFPWPQPDSYVPRLISLDLQQKILDAIPEPRRGAFLACARLGLRPNEARVVQVCDWRGDELLIRRGQKDRRVGGVEGGTKKRQGTKLLPITADLEEWLELHASPEDRLVGDRLLFRNPAAQNARGQWSEAAMRRAWYSACNEAGVKIGLYEGTKHSTGTALKAAGVDDRVLAQLFGHSDTRSVQRYARVQTEVVRQAIRSLPKRRR